MHAEIINATANNARVSCKGGGRRAYPEDIELVVEAHGAEIKGWRRKCPKRRLHRPIQHDADERARYGRALFRPPLPAAVILPLQRFSSWPL